MGKKPEPTPEQQYDKQLEAVKKNYMEVKLKHDKASVGVYAAINKDFQKIDPQDHVKVYELLKNAAIEYKKQTGIINGKANEEFELGEVHRAMEQNRLDPAAVVKKFRNGEGKDVIDTLLGHYQQIHIQGKHKAWYNRNIGLDYKKRDILAKGFKAHHKSSDPEQEISSDLEHRLLQAAAQESSN